MMNNILFEYHKYYKDINFERQNLFKIIAQKYKINSVLYPGSSIHITPSFIFPMVTYIDNSELSEKFFADLNKVIEIIDSNKVYKGKPQISYYKIDYKKLFKLHQQKFDLLLSIFANNIIVNFIEYLKKDGLIIINNYNNEIEKIINDPQLIIVDIIESKDDHYKVETYDKSKMSIKRKKNIVKSNKGFKFRDNDIYYVLKRKDNYK